MPEPDQGPVVGGPLAVYDAVASAYDDQLHDELVHKPLDRAMLTGFLELAGEGTIADVGCGPGHVTRWIAERHADVVGIDLSPAMVSIAKDRAPEITFRVASMLALAEPDASLAGAIALYSVIHLSAAERATAFAELSRAIRPGGWLLVSFHVATADVAAGDVHQLTTWFGHSVDLAVHFLEPVVVTAELVGAGFEVTARLDRQPTPDHEYPSRRCSLLARRG